MGGYIDSGVYSGKTVTDLTNVASKVEYAFDENKTYFAPPRRIKQFYELIDMMDELPKGTFTRGELNSFFRHRYYELLMNVSYALRTIYKAPEWMLHYGQKIRILSISEMLRNIFTARQAAKTHLKEKGTYSLARQLIIDWSTLKAMISTLSKLAVRSVLEPLGIYKLLHDIKQLLV